jgi:hypothetical protein
LLAAAATHLGRDVVLQRLEQPSRLRQQTLTHATRHTQRNAVSRAEQSRQEEDKNKKT